MRIVSASTGTTFTFHRDLYLMRVVIIGGNERMVCQYKDICKNHGCEAKVFVKKERGCLKKKMGRPDLLILFTNTVSHSMVTNGAVDEAKRNDVPIARVHSSSASALNQVLRQYCGGCAYV